MLCFLLALTAAPHPASDLSASPVLEDVVRQLAALQRQVAELKEENGAMRETMAQMQERSLTTTDVLQLEHNETVTVGRPALPVSMAGGGGA